MTFLDAAAWFGLGYISAIVTVLGLFVWAALRLRGPAEDRTELDNEAPATPHKARGLT